MRTDQAATSTPALKAKVSFYDFILSDRGLIEVARIYVLDYRCLLLNVYSILLDPKIHFY